MSRYVAIGEAHPSPYYHRTEEFQHYGVQAAFTLCKGGSALQATGVLVAEDDHHDFPEFIDKHENSICCTWHLSKYRELRE